VFLQQFVAVETINNVHAGNDVGDLSLQKTNKGKNAHVNEALNVDSSSSNLLKPAFSKIKTPMDLL
jgi:hypothetical protein